MVMENGQSAAKGLSIEEIISIYDQSSTTIPNGSKLLDKIKVETPDIIFKNIFDNCVIKESCVYIIIHLETLKFYIGSTKNLQHRIRKHRGLIKGNHYNYKFRRIKNIDQFYIGVLKYTEETNLEIEELEYLRKFFSFEELILNMVLDTKRNFVDDRYSELLQNMNRVSMKTIYCYSYPSGKFIKSFESISSASRSLGLQRSNIRKCLKDEIRYIKKFTFRNFYAESITIRNRNTLSVLKNIEKSKKKIIDVNSGNVYESISEAERNLNICKGTLFYRIKHNINYKEYLFKYYEDIV